jgi:hypothetical protein
MHGLAKVDLLALVAAAVVAVSEAALFGRIHHAAEEWPRVARHKRRDCRVVDEQQEATPNWNDRGVMMMMMMMMRSSWNDNDEPVILLRSFAFVASRLVFVVRRLVILDGEEA